MKDILFIMIIIPWQLGFKQAKSDLTDSGCLTVCGSMGAALFNKLGSGPQLCQSESQFHLLIQGT